MRLILLSIILCSELAFTQVRTSENISVDRARTRVSGFFWVEKGETDISTLNPYLWMDASSDIYFEDTSGNPISCVNPNETYTAKNWLDRSGNNRDFVAPSNDQSPTFKCDSQERPLYQFDSNLESDGTDDVMIFDFENAPAGTEDGLSGTINSSFTFVFVMQATGTYATNKSFIANSDSWNGAGSWQIGATANTANIYFRMPGNNTALIPFDTNPHVYLIQRNGNNMTYKVDGVTIATQTVSNPPTLQKLKLYTNRSSEPSVYLKARFFEFFVFDGTLSVDDEFTLQQYLLSKWGV